MTGFFDLAMRDLLIFTSEVVEKVASSSFEPPQPVQLVTNLQTHVAKRVFRIAARIAKNMKREVAI